jgi:hypothetical protein
MGFNLPEQHRHSHIGHCAAFTQFGTGCQPGPCIVIPITLQICLFEEEVGLGTLKNARFSKIKF